MKTDNSIKTTQTLLNGVAGRLKTLNANYGRHFDLAVLGMGLIGGIRQYRLRGRVKQENENIKSHRAYLKKTRDELDDLVSISMSSAPANRTPSKGTLSLTKNSSYQYLWCLGDLTVKAEVSKLIDTEFLDNLEGLKTQFLNVKVGGTQTVWSEAFTSAVNSARFAHQFFLAAEEEAYRHDDVLALKGTHPLQTKLNKLLKGKQTTNKDSQGVAWALNNYKARIEWELQHKPEKKTPPSMLRIFASVVIAGLIVGLRNYAPSLMGRIRT